MEEFDCDVDVEEPQTTFVADSVMSADIPDLDTTCSVCYAEFLDSDDLELHMIQVHHKKSSSFMNCPFCLKSQTSLEDYALHLRDTHLQSLKCCKYCMRAYIDYDLLRKHEAKHYNLIQRSMYSCSQCSKLFTNIVELEKHENEIHHNSTDGVLLQNCLSLLSSILNIKAIKFLKAYGDDTVYLCVKCKHMTADVKDYLNHLKKENCRSFVCDICSNVYDSKRYLINHLQKSKWCKPDYQNQGAKQCSKCFQYFNQHILKAHYSACKPIKCKTCNIVFDSTYELSIHQSNEHPVTALVRRCTYCSTDFVGEVALEKHINRVHKPQFHLYKYFCSYCPKRQVFKHPKLLFAHFFSKHKDIEPYNCTICNKKFKLRKKFTLHIKLDHKSMGSVEFDDKFNVLFTKSKTTNFKPNPLNSGSSLRKAARLTEDEAQDVEGSLSPEARSEVETESPAEKSLQKNLISKRITRSRKKDSKNQPDESSEDEPLLVVKKRIKKIDKNRYIRKTRIKDNTKRYVCSICKKNCKNAENHRRHFYSHSMKGTKKCIKCNENFKTSKELTDHITSKHSTSKLTDTLKKLLEQRRQNPGSFAVRHEIASELFRKTIKRVPEEKSGIVAILTEVEKDANSVQSFIKNFTPDSNENIRKNLIVTASVTVKSVKSTHPKKKPLIKLLKFTPELNNGTKPKLSMPVRFKPSIVDQPTVSIRVVEKLALEESENNIESGEYNNYGNDDIEDSHSYYDDEQEENQSEVIPDVAQEVMVDETEKVGKSAPPVAKIIIPQLPKYQDISIAHLQTKAPYYKIVKVNDILQENKKESELKKKKPKPIQLPSGAKLVNVNPLAHLLGDNALKSLVKKSKYYKYQPKIKPTDIESAITKALVELETSKGPTTKKKKPKISI